MSEKVEMGMLYTERSKIGQIQSSAGSPRYLCVTYDKYVETIHSMVRQVRRLYFTISQTNWTLFEGVLKDHDDQKLAQKIQGQR